MYMDPGSPISPQAMMRPPYMPGMGSPEGIYLAISVNVIIGFYVNKNTYSYVVQTLYSVTILSSLAYSCCEHAV